MGGRAASRSRALISLETAAAWLSLALGRSRSLICLATAAAWLSLALGRSRSLICLATAAAWISLALGRSCSLICLATCVPLGSHWVLESFGGVDSIKPSAHALAPTAFASPTPRPVAGTCVKRPAAPLSSALSRAADPRLRGTR